MGTIKTSTSAVERERERIRNIQAWVKVIGGLIIFGCLVVLIFMGIFMSPQ